MFRVLAVVVGVIVVIGGWGMYFYFRFFAASVPHDMSNQQYAYVGMGIGAVGLYLASKLVRHRGNGVEAADRRDRELAARADHPRE